eukprot:TRINITY_DN1338_c0_g1_i1.p1 TRINITY_DN1338_c0_g1~~TRINITY_DN1338_c0_g1_i1.p1  ORF type:complete len:342 (-),score=19.13 TRINITY_DN1338_c0_g1_i1:2080-3105(-)
MLRKEIISIIILLAAMYFSLAILLSLPGLIYVQQQQQSKICQYYFKFQDNKVHANAAIFNSRNNKRNRAFGNEEFNSIHSRVFFINGSKPRQQFILSFALKGGTTRTSQMIEKLINDQFKGVFEPWIYKDVWFRSSLTNFYEETVEKILTDPAIPRIVIVRDPYTRFLSAYNDKIRKQNVNDELGFDIHNRASFDEFVERIYSIRKQKNRGVTAGNYGLNAHFAQQVESSMVSFGMRYNYVLKLEEIGNWFSCFMDLVNIREEMMHGWPGDDQCFLSTPAAPCNGPSQNGSVITNLINYANHNYNSVKNVDCRYKNVTTTQLTTQMFLEDFIYFDYPIRLR